MATWKEVLYYWCLNFHSTGFSLKICPYSFWLFLLFPVHRCGCGGVLFVIFVTLSSTDWKQEVLGCMEAAYLLWSQRRKPPSGGPWSRCCWHHAIFLRLKQKSLIRNSVPEFGGRVLWRILGSVSSCLPPSWEVFLITCWLHCGWPLWAVGGVVNIPKEAKTADKTRII